MPSNPISDIDGILGDLKILVASRKIETISDLEKTIKKKIHNLICPFEIQPPYKSIKGESITHGKNEIS